MVGILVFISAFKFAHRPLGMVPISIVSSSYVKPLEESAGLFRDPNVSSLNIIDSYMVIPMGNSFVNSQYGSDILGFTACMACSNALQNLMC
jgi:hypothetical protein